MFLKLLAILLTLTLSSCVSQNRALQEKQAGNYLKIGSAHLRKGNYPAAMSSLLRAEELSPGHPVIQHNLGLAYYVRQRYSLAEEHVKKSIRIDSKFTEARVTLGKIYISMGLYEKAIAELKVAAEDLTYDNPKKVLFNLGLAYFNLENYQLSKESFKKYLKMNNRNCLAYNYYGRSLFLLQKYITSAEVFDRAENSCKKDPNADYLYYSAMSYFYAHRREESRQRLEQFLDKFPSSVYVPHVKKVLKKLK